MEGFLAFGTINDEKTFKGLFDSLYLRLVAFAKRYVSDLQVAEDIVQDSFVYLWNHRNYIDAQKSVKTVLYTAVKHRCLNYLRDDKLRKHHYKMWESNIESDLFFESTLIEEEVFMLITEALKTAGEKTQNVFKMTLEGYKAHEISEVLQIPLRTVKYHKTQARLVLTHALKGKPLLLLTTFFSLAVTIAVNRYVL